MKISRITLTLSDLTFLTKRKDTTILTLIPKATISVYGSSWVKADERRTLNLRGTIVPPRW